MLKYHKNMVGELTALMQHDMESLRSSSGWVDISIQLCSMDVHNSYFCWEAMEKIKFERYPYLLN